MREHFPVAAENSGDQIESVTLENLQKQRASQTSPRNTFVDATELGELLPLTNTEFVTGSESNSETNEPNAKEIADATNSQAFSVCFAMSYHAGENHTIARPENYDFWRDFEPPISPAVERKITEFDRFESARFNARAL